MKINNKIYNHIYKYSYNNNDGHKWTKIPGLLGKDISVGKEGIIWGVNASDYIYTRGSTGWTQVSGGLVNVSVNNEGTIIWGVNASDDIYRKTSVVDWDNKSNGNTYKVVDIGGSDEIVYAITKDNKLHKWNVPDNKFEEVKKSDGNVVSGYTNVKVSNTGIPFLRKDKKLYIYYEGKIIEHEEFNKAIEGKNIGSPSGAYDVA